jgi:hypothetical protein
MATLQPSIELKVRLFVYVQCGAKPLDAIIQACLDTGIELTAPMEKYAHSYVFNAKKWLTELLDHLPVATQMVPALTASVIRFMNELENELVARSKALQG